MKLDNFERRRAGVLCNVPLRTTTEMADEFGVDRSLLGRLLKKDPAAPTPRVNSRSATVKNLWYDPREVRKWWATRKAEA